MTKTIYLDYNSTTPVDPAVLNEMLPFFTQYFGNAASKTHKYGWEASHAVEQARIRVASMINAEPDEIIFTSGSTESINIALNGLAGIYGHKRKTIITAPTEHKAILDTCDMLAGKGYQIRYLSIDREGNIDLNELDELLNEGVLSVCLMMANNETGVIHPAAEIGKRCHDKNVFFFTDATQAAGKLHIDVQDLKADLLCISSHKIYGPKGSGALYIRRKNPAVKLSPYITGGGHEKGLRSGTLNVPAIVGIGMACELSTSLFWEETARISKYRTTLEQLIEREVSISINGNMRSRLCNTSNLCFNGIEAARLIKVLPELAFSTGSACSSALPEPSHVLKSMGLTDNEVYSSVRFSIGRFTTENEIATSAELISNAVKGLMKEADI